jgi:hypothetical protein
VMEARIDDATGAGRGGEKKDDENQESGTHPTKCNGAWGGRGGGQGDKENA